MVHEGIPLPLIQRQLGLGWRRRRPQRGVDTVADRHRIGDLKTRSGRIYDRLVLLMSRQTLCVRRFGRCGHRNRANALVRSRR